MAINYWKELFETKQFKNSVEQLRNVLDKRWFDLMFNLNDTESWVTITMTRDKTKSKEYQKLKSKKIEAFRLRRSKYFEWLGKPKKKIRLVRRRS